MDKIVVWGAGKCAEKFLQYIDKKKVSVQIVAIVDSFIEKQGKMWNGYIVQKPQVILRIQFDKVITSRYMYDEVYAQLTAEFSSDYRFMSNGEITILDTFHYIMKEPFLHFYNKVQDMECLQCVDWVKNHPIDVFNYDFAKKYKNMHIEVYLDNSCGLYYFYYRSKRMYLSRAFNNINKVRRYIKYILMEQDKESPHRYLDSEFMVKDGSVVLDAGAAEGNFALDIIDNIKKLYIVEADELWVEALSHTFFPYKEKVEIIKGFLSDNNLNGNVTIDSIFQYKQLDFIKMDIEGSEISALKGGLITLLKNTIKLSVCTYHHIDDYLIIKGILCKIGYECCSSKGYMLFLNDNDFDELEPPRLVRGVLRAEKKTIMERLVLFGTGNYLQIYKNTIDKSNIIAFVDNDEKKHGTYIDGIPIMAPEKITSLIYDKVCLMAKADFRNDMMQQLVKIGVDKNNIIDGIQEFTARSQYKCIQITYRQDVCRIQRKLVILFNPSLTNVGAVIVSLYVSKILIKNGFCVVVISPIDGPIKAEFENIGAIVIIAEDTSTNNMILWSWIEKAKLVFINTLYFNYLLNDRTILGKKCIWWLHEGALFYSNYKIMLNVIDSDNIRIFGVSEVAKRAYQNYFSGNKIGLLPFGIPDEKIDNTQSENSKKIFAIIGLISEVKGTDIFINAVKTLSDDEKKLSEFWIIGAEGKHSFYNSLRKISEEVEEIIWFDELEHVKLLELYPKITAIVCPSREETLSAVSVEALMNNKICITSDVVGIADFLEHGKNGLIFKSADILDLVEQIRWVLQNPDRLKEMGDSARKIYEHNFTLEVFEQNLLSIVDTF